MDKPAIVAPVAVDPEKIIGGLVLVQVRLVAELEAARARIAELEQLVPKPGAEKPAEG